MLVSKSLSLGPPGPSPTCGGTTLPPACLEALFCHKIGPHLGFVIPVHVHQGEASTRVHGRKGMLFPEGSGWGAEQQSVLQGGSPRGPSPGLAELAPIFRRFTGCCSEDCGWEKTAKGCHTSRTWLGAFRGSGVWGSVVLVGVV